MSKKKQGAFLKELSTSKPAPVKHTKFAWKGPASGQSASSPEALGFTPAYKESRTKKTQDMVRETTEHKLEIRKPKR